MKLGANYRLINAPGHVHSNKFKEQIQRDLARKIGEKLFEEGFINFSHENFPNWTEIRATTNTFSPQEYEEYLNLKKIFYPQVRYNGPWNFK